MDVREVPQATGGRFVVHPGREAGGATARPWRRGRLRRWPRCTYTVPDKNASGDNFYGAVICNQAYVDYFWNTYGFSGNKVYWDDGWGWDDCCNTSKPLARAFNGCYALTYSAQDYLNDSYSSPILNWGRRYVRENIDALRCFCGDGTAIARSQGGGLVEVYLGLLLHQGRPRAGRDADPRVPSPGREAARRQLPVRLDVRQREVGRRFELGLRGRLDVRRPVPLVVLRGRGTHHVGPSGAGSSARERGHRQRVRDPPRLLDLTRACYTPRRSS